MKQKVKFFVVVCALLLGVSGIAWADPMPEVQKQIDHLIAHLRDSKLTFIRNGSETDSEAAAKHVQEKYEHFKSEVVTARDFIDKAASRSLLTGKPYLVKFADGSTKEVSVWLQEELAKQPN
ncbi:MAG: DUF5329 family protein [Bdellovibrionota bacterium]